MKKKSKENEICIIFVLFLLTFSFSNCVGGFEVRNDCESCCYGFIITPLRGENFTLTDQINCNIRHLINDLLREDVQVYWIAEAGKTEAFKLNAERSIVFSDFDPGCFLIPFTGDLTIDNKIIAIIGDYNIYNEIDVLNYPEVPVYLILDKLSFDAYPLNKVNAALFYSSITTGELAYLESITKCGFLDYEIIKDKEIKNELDNNKFNVLLQPGELVGTSQYLVKAFHKVHTDISKGTSNGVRNFVKNGGGYIGSCAGLANAGAGGLVPFPIYLRRRVNNPDLPSIAFYAIIDILIKKPETRSFDNQIKIVNSSSPITFSLDEIVWDYWCGGPDVFYKGKNVETVGEFYNTNTKSDGSPAWLTSQFGKGKIAVFSPHPEIAGVIENPTYQSQSNTGKTVISNSLFFTTSDKKIKYTVKNSQSFEYVLNYLGKTYNLTHDVNKTVGYFNSTRDEVNKTIKKINYLSNNIVEVSSIIENIAEENNIDLSKDEEKYYLGYDFIRDIIKLHYKRFFNFLNKSFIVFDKIELITELLINDTSYKNGLINLSSELHYRLKTINSLFDKNQELIIQYKKDLLQYKEYKNRNKLKEKLLENKANSIYVQDFSIFSQIPKVCTESLKFLRSSWYDFEANLSIDYFEGGK